MLLYLAKRSKTVESIFESRFPKLVSLNLSRKINQINWWNSDLVKYFQYTPALKELNLSGIENLKTQELEEVIKQCTLITKLTIEKCPFAGKVSLTGLALLETLSMQGCEKVASVELNPAVNLKYINLSNCIAVDITFLKNLKNIESFIFAGCNQISEADLNAIITNQTATLQSLNLLSSQVKDLSCIAKCTKLKELILGDTKITKIAPIIALPSLTTFLINGTSVSDFDYILHLNQLEKLGVPFNFSESIEKIIPYISNIKQIVLDYDQLDNKSIEALSKFKGLKSLRIGQAIFDISILKPLKGNLHLEEIILYGNIPDINDMASQAKKIFKILPHIKRVKTINHLSGEELIYLNQSPKSCCCSIS